MDEKDYLNETAIEMMMTALINKYKNNKKEFIENVVKTKEYVQIVPAESPYMNEKNIKMQLKFTLENISIMDILEKESEKNND